ncbi:PI-PLC X domain-containing protein 1 [Brachionichthys hirsutus]|uniref:PI-PLC X domain-containing protein 1 n=1 Tax=Brachionichthys hirsutus TaxID=412623 RepID=UPI00360516ED
MDLSSEDWMASLPEELWDVPLSNLAIPGSHDAMTYCLDCCCSPLVPSEPDNLRLLDRLFPCITRPFIIKWATTQYKSIEEQLSMGIRYFDFRIAHKPNDSSNDLYFKHAIYTHLTAQETLQSVASWLHAHPKEVVILACSHFEGMTYELHQAFVSTLNKLFDSKLCPWTETVLTLRSLWKSGYQVILSYDYHGKALNEDELWPAIPYWWADQPTAKGVITYLESKKNQGRPGDFFVAGLNLTTDRSYIVEHICQSLRTLTFSNWESLQKWLKDQQPGSSPKSLNIIAGDFLGPLPLCPLVIALNQKLLKKNCIR